MAKRSIRVMLWGIIVCAAVAAAYFFWVDESATGRETAAARAFEQSADAAGRALLDLRAAQQAYVAAGQGEEFWATKVTASVATARQALDAMRRDTSAAVRTAVESASATLEDFEQMDRRAREYARGGQNLMASDVIFSAGAEMTESAWADVQRARTAFRQARDEAARSIRQRQWMTLAVGALAVSLLTLLLVPVPRSSHGRPAVPEPTPAAISTDDDGLELRAAPDGDAVGPDRSPGPPPTVDVESVAQPEVDLAAVASVCTDLARVTDTRSLPPVLARASDLLDAAGIVLWIADPDGRELAPIVAHGYSPQLVTRLGLIPRGAENVTAAAFRTGLLQTVKADAVSNGAIAAPLVTPAGCVGVMAAEVRNGGEQQDARLAAAAIVAAQLATLVGPPVARGTKAEAAHS